MLPPGVVSGRLFHVMPGWAAWFRQNIKTPAAKKFPRLHHKEYRQGNFSIYWLCSVLIAAQGIALTAQDTQRLHGGFAHAHFHHGSFVGGAKGIALGHDCTFFYRQPA